jgi:hypothetical protein
MRTNTHVKAGSGAGAFAGARAEVTGSAGLTVK